jgi:iron complex outermembrane recepter protein
VANAVNMPDVQDPLGLTRAELQANPRQASPAALQFNTRKSVDQQQFGVIVEHQLDAANGLKLTTWRGQRSTEQFQAIPVATQTPITHPGGVIDLDRAYMGVDGQWIYKSRLAGKPLTVTAGLYADQLKEQRQGFLNFTSPTTLGVQGALRRDEDNRVRSFDQYAQANWESERFGLTAGLRHSALRFRSDDHFIVGANGDDSGAATYSATTPMAGLVYHVSDNLNVYGAVGRGFETPTFNELSYRPNGQTGLNFDLRPAYSRHYEVGVKAEPVRNWRVNAALFQANTSDEIVVLTNQGGRSTFQNASSTRRRGLEAALAGSWADAWSTYAALTWLDATYRTAFLTCPGAPCPTAANPAVPVAAGNRIPGIPRASAFAELVYRHRPWGLEAGLELRYVGRIAVDDRNTDFAPSATLWNLRLALAQNIQHWTVREFMRVDNLAGRNYVGSVIVNEGNSRFFEPAPGRTWLLGVSALYSF